MNVSHIDQKTLERFGLLNEQFFNFFKANQFDEAWALSSSINEIFHRISNPPVYQQPQGLSFDISASVGHYFLKPDEQWLPAWKKGGFFDFIVVNCSHEALKEFITHPEANLKYNNSRQCSTMDIRDKIHVDKHYDCYRFFKDNQALFDSEQQAQIRLNFIHASMVYGAEKVFFDAFNTQGDDSFYFSRLIQRYPGAEEFLGHILTNRPTFLNDKQYHEALYLYIAYHIIPQFNEADFNEFKPLIQSVLHYDETREALSSFSYLGQIGASMLNRFDFFQPYIVPIFNLLEEQQRFDLITSIGRAFLNDLLLNHHILLKGLHSHKDRIMTADDYSTIEQSSSFLANLSDDAFQAFIDYGKTIQYEPVIDNQAISSYLHLNPDTTTVKNVPTNKKIALFYQYKKQFINKVFQYRKILADTEEQAEKYHGTSEKDNDFRGINRLKI
jgi:hypothetical protein